MLGLERPPRWGIVTLAVLLVANAALLSFLFLRPAPVDPNAGHPAPVAQTSEATRSPGENADPEAGAAENSAVQPVLAVYGDGYSAGSTLGGLGGAGWPALVAQQAGATLRLNAASMTGYVAVGTTGESFAGLVAVDPVPDAAVTVVFGSRNDLGSPAADVGAAAAETYAEIRAAAPGTKLVVVGPAWSHGDVPADLLAVRDAVQEAALAAGATFIDPLRQGWFSDSTGIASDGISPTDEGHVFLATNIAPAVQQALTANQ